MHVGPRLYVLPGPVHTKWYVPIWCCWVGGTDLSACLPKCVCSRFFEAHASISCISTLAHTGPILDPMGTNMGLVSELEPCVGLLWYKCGVHRHIIILLLSFLLLCFGHLYWVLHNWFSSSVFLIYFCQENYMPTFNN